MKAMEVLNISKNKENNIKGVVVPPNYCIRLNGVRYAVEYTTHSIVRCNRIYEEVGNIQQLMQRFFYLLKEVETYITEEINEGERFILHDRILNFSLVIEKEENKLVLITVIDVIGKSNLLGIRLAEGQKVIIFNDNNIEFFIFWGNQDRKEFDTL